MIEVKSLVKKYGNHVAVDGLSFIVEKGQVLGFLGPNGAGKSTTMNMITGYISATEGSVSINGIDIYDEPEEAKKHIGYLPELPPVYPDMTVDEYLYFVAEIKKVEKKNRKSMLDEIKNRTQIEEVSGRLIKHLSKGFKQRVGLAQAIIGYPEVLVLDEPTVGLDPMQIIEIRDLIRELARKHTIILSSHILSEVSAICDTVMIINKGKLVVADQPENLSKHIAANSGIHMQVKGEQEVVNHICQSVQGVTKVDFLKNIEEGLLSLTVYPSADVDIRGELFLAFANAGCPIYEMHSSTVSLEEIFLEVTKEDYNKKKDILDEENERLER